MTIQEERLRHLLHQAVPEPTAVIDYETVGLKIRRRRRAKLLVSAVAVVLVAGAGGITFAAVTGGSTDGQQQIVATPGPSPKASCTPTDAIGVYPSHAPGPGVNRQILAHPIIIPITHAGTYDKVFPAPTFPLLPNSFSIGYRFECGTAKYSALKYTPKRDGSGSTVIAVHLVVTSYTGTPSLVLLNVQVEDQGEASPSAPAVNATTAAQEPGWLPPGAKLFKRTTTGVNDKGVLLIYTLPGAANANPSAQLQVSSIPDIVNPPAPYTDPAAGIVGESVTVSGVPATLVHSTNGLGTWRVTWLTGTTYHSVSDEHLQSPQGVSGIDEADLLRIADSIAH